MTKWYAPLEQLIETFVEKHDLTETQQFRALVEEVGELSEALNTGGEDDEVLEELADIVFIAYTLAIMRDESLTDETWDVADENLAKSPSREGEKITKEVSTDD